MRQKEHLHLGYGPEHDLDGLVSINGIVEVEEHRVELSEARLSIQTLEAGEDGWRFIVSKTLSAHLCRVVGWFNHPLHKYQHVCTHVLEVVPEIFLGLPLLCFRLLVRVSDRRRGNFEEGSHINRILPRDGVEEVKGLYVHHVARVSIVGINEMFNLA